MEETHPNRGGAPKGNKNALKHGFYSQLHQQKKRLSLPSAEVQTQPDIALFRALLLRVTASLASAEAAPSCPAPPGGASFVDDLYTLHLVCIAVARLNSLWRTNERLFKDGTSSLLDTFQSFGFSAEQLRSEIFSAPKTHKGAQLGNSNAVRHGLYASPFSQAEIDRLEDKDNLSVESKINFPRVLLLRAACSMRFAVGLDRKMNMKALQVFTLAATIIERLECRKIPAFGGPHRLEDLVDSIIREGSKKP